MSKTADRVKLAEAILALVEKQRAESGDEHLGTDIVEFLIEAQFHDLETEILQNPGAIEPWLVRRRRNEN
ncbi:MAG: hypothetical protein JWP63_2924 [Candidatus Solibacter sp.]|jgi:hypothetical protein|nr:hypothetical protein [Candidatus Solibacter sp.]